MIVTIRLVYYLLSRYCSYQSLRLHKSREVIYPLIPMLTDTVVTSDLPASLLTGLS